MICCDEIVQQKELKCAHRIELIYWSFWLGYSSGVKVSKKKKLVKIDPSKAGSGRLVFDEEGNAVPPFAALASQNELQGTSGKTLLYPGVAR